MISAILAGLLVCSLVGNVTAILFFKKKPPQMNDRTASELLHDLTAYGNALIRIERIAPSDVLLRSPRQ